MLQGVVTNVTAFGAFVDVGVHQDGLVHVSQLSTRFVKDPSEVVKVGDRLTVKVLTVDLARKRLACPCSALTEGTPPRRPQPSHRPRRSAGSGGEARERQERGGQEPPSRNLPPSRSTIRLVNSNAEEVATRGPALGTCAP